MNRILLIDDDKLIIASLSKNLRNEGWDVLTAQTRAEALQIVKDRYFDLAVVDLFLESNNEEGGKEMALKIKEKDSEIPVIILTAHGRTALAVDLMKIVDDFVEKPGTMLLLSKIRTFLDATLLQQKARRGLEIYLEKFSKELRVKEHGRSLAIDIASGNYYLADRNFDAAEAAIKHGAEPKSIVIRKVGYQVSDTIGGAILEEEF